MKSLLLALSILVSTLFSGCNSPSINQNAIDVTPPASGDAHAYLMKQINYALDHNIKTVRFKFGTYNISKPLLIERAGKMVSLNLIGEEAAHFDLEQNEVRIVYNQDTGYAIGYQLGRSSMIKGLVIYGNGIRQDTRFAALAGISIDPYHRGITNGSSGILIEQCRIRNFTVGIMIAQNGVTLNAENIHVENVSIDGVKVAYATTHNQSKANTVKNLICWDNIETIFDGVEYGQGLGNIPFIDGVNAAGSVGRIFNFNAQNFATSANHIFAEEIKQIGTIVDGGVGVTIRDSHFNFLFWYFPNYHFKGNNITFDNCSIRYYDGYNNKRIIFDGVNNTFLNGYFDLPPMVKNTDWEEAKRTSYYYNYKVISGSKMKTVSHTEIETYYWLDQQWIDVENKWCIVNRPHNAKVNDYLDQGHPFNVFARVARVSGDTLFLDAIQTGMVTQRIHCGLNGFK